MSIVLINSPNFGRGRQGRKIDYIIMHWMAGNLASTDVVFQDTQRQSSAHYGIEDDRIHQYVKEEDTAWHCGNYEMNLRSIGIEHSAQPGRDASAATIETSARLVADICKRYSIPCDRAHILKHSEVFNTQCPGTLPIDTIIAKANNIIGEDDMMTLDTPIATVLARAFYGPGADAGAIQQLVDKSKEKGTNTAIYFAEAHPAHMGYLKYVQDLATAAVNNPANKLDTKKLQELIDAVGELLKAQEKK